MVVGVGGGGGWCVGRKEQDNFSSLLCSMIQIQRDGRVCVTLTTSTSYSFISSFLLFVAFAIFIKTYIRPSNKTGLFLVCVCMFYLLFTPPFVTITQPTLLHIPFNNIDFIRFVRLLVQFVPCLFVGCVVCERERAVLLSFFYCHQVSHNDSTSIIIMGSTKRNGTKHLRFIQSKWAHFGHNILTCKSHSINQTVGFERRNSLLYLDHRCFWQIACHARDIFLVFPVLSLNPLSLAGIFFMLDLTFGCSCRNSWCCCCFCVLSFWLRLCSFYL